MAIWACPDLSHTGHVGLCRSLGFHSFGKTFQFRSELLTSGDIRIPGGTGRASECIRNQKSDVCHLASGGGGRHPEPTGMHWDAKEHLVSVAHQVLLLVVWFVRLLVCCPEWRTAENYMRPKYQSRAKRRSVSKLYKDAIAPPLRR